MENKEYLEELKENNELLRKSIEFQKEINKNLRISRRISIIICLFVIIGFVLVLNTINKIDINSLNNSLENMSNITEQFKNKEIDTESLNSLILNLSKITENINDFTDSTQDKIDNIKDFGTNVKDNISDKFNNFFKKEEPKE